MQYPLTLYQCKKWFRHLSLAALILPAAIMMRAQATGFSLSHVSALPGDSVSVPLNITNFQNIGSFNLFIEYDPLVLGWGSIIGVDTTLAGGILTVYNNGNRLGIAWVNGNGVSLPDGKIAELRFIYHSGVSLLDFIASGSLVTDPLGQAVAQGPVFTDGLVSRKLQATITATDTIICEGTNVQIQSALTGGYGTIQYQWTSDPPGFFSTNQNIQVNPTVTTVYNLVAYDGMDTITESFELKVYLPSFPGAVTSMIPSDSTGGLNFPFLLSWNPASNTAAYDIYLWKSGMNEPTQAYASNIASISYLISGGLEFGQVYNWRVVSKNPCYITAGPVSSFIIRHLPNLIVENTGVPLSGFSNQPVSVSWQVRNNGQGSSLSSTWYDAVYLSADDEFNTSFDYFAGIFPNLSALAPGISYQRNVTFNLPQGISGYHHVFVLTDYQSQLRETSESDNLGKSQDSILVTLSPTPDLQVTSLVIPSNIFSGNPLPVTWTVRNAGQAITPSGIWTDRIYLSPDTIFTASAQLLATFTHQGILAPDSTYTKTQQVTIPDYIQGRFYLFAFTDAYNTVYEHAQENNNRLRSDSLTVFLTPPPDLVVTGVSGPGNVSNGETVTVSFTVENQGINPAAGGWVDRIYISPSPVFQGSSAYLLKEVPRYQSLPPGESYTTLTNVIIPKINGDAFYYVFSDGSMQVFEYDQEENNILRGNACLVNSPDLQVRNVIPPPSGNSGQPVNVAYTIINEGPGKATGTWTDRLYLSQFPVFNANASYLLTSKNFNNQVLNPGDSISAVMQGILPEGISGDYYVFVFTDISNNIFEHTFENNNTGQGQAAIPVMLTPWCDLHVLEVFPSLDTAEAGFPLTVTWTVKNSGPGTNLVYAWRDQVLVTASTSPFAAAYTLKTIQIYDTLAPDSSYTVTTQVILPYSLISQPYYLMVRTDIDNTIYEHGQDANNTAYSPAFFVKPYPPVDLQLTQMNAPFSANSGSSIPVTWSVLNASSVLTIPTYWHDNLYLSSDTVWNPSADIETGFTTRYGSLEANAGYTSTRDFIIPNGISGTYYLIMVADRNNVNQDADFSNNSGLVRDENGTPQPVTITLTPPPDLVVTSLEASGTALTGQPFMLRYTVENKGSGVTTPASWTDRFYLSSSMNFNPNTFSIGAKAHYGSLAPGESYTDSLSVTMPNWPGGNYILFIKTDANNLVYEHGLEDNNLKPKLVFLQQPPPADLVATQVIVPDTVMAGGSCTIYWTLQNQGTFPVSGNMTELVYFSTDDVWDIGDILFTSITGPVSLGPQTALGRSATAVLNDVSVGQWHVIVRTDVLNNIFESNESNNHGASAEKTLVTVPELPFDTWTPDILVNDIPLYYRIEIPAELAEESMLVRLKGDSVFGINELYLKHGSVPTRSSFDYAFTEAASGNQDIIVPSLVPGTYYVLVYGKHPDRTEQDIQLFARILEFEILGIHANTGGNTGKITVQITGSKFTPGMSVFLHRNEEKVFGYDLVFVNSSRVYVTFDLEARELGLYDVAGDKQCGGLALLKDGFRVVQGLYPSLDVNVYQPPNARPNGIVPIIIEYANSGTANLDLPNLILKSVAGAPVAFNLSGLEQDLYHLLIELRETGGPPGILRPGVSGSVTVFSKASKGLGFSIQIPKY